jgi:hypothetical protein
MELTDIYRTFHPTGTEHTFLSVASGTFSKREHILDHEASLDNTKKLK